MSQRHCLVTSSIFTVLGIYCLYLLMGCSAGRMNAFDSAAATAHSQMQQAAVAAILQQAATPLCQINFQPGVPVTGVTGITCSAPTDYGKLLAVLTQYNSPDGAREILARGGADMMKYLPAALLGYVGIKEGNQTIREVSANSANMMNAAGTHVTMNGNNNGANLVGPTNITAGAGGIGGAGGTTPGGAGGSTSISTTGITDNSNRTHAPTIMEPRDPIIVTQPPPIIVQPSYPPVVTP